MHPQSEELPSLAQRVTDLIRNLPNSNLSWVVEPDDRLGAVAVSMGAGPGNANWLVRSLGDFLANLS